MVCAFVKGKEASMNSNRTSLLLASLLAVGFFLSGLEIHRTGQDNDSFGISDIVNYIIPRLGNYVPSFSLWDRKFVDKRKFLPKAKTKPSSVAAATPSPTPTPLPTPVPKAKPVATSKTPKTTIGNPAADSRLALDNSPPPQPLADPQFDPNANIQTNGIASPFAPQAETLVGDWHMKILREPTKETMNELISEFQAGRITKEVFYGVLVELLEDPGADLQKLSLYALAAIPTFDSLATVLRHREQLQPENNEMVEFTLRVFAHPDYLSVLHSGLKSAEEVVALGTMPLVVKASSQITLWNADHGTEGNDRHQRDRRGPTNGVPKKGLMQVLDTLKELAESRNTRIADSARDSLQQINYRPSSTISQY